MKNTILLKIIYDYAEEYIEFDSIESMREYLDKHKCRFIKGLVCYTAIKMVKPGHEVKL